jgi:hypothetical protein
MKPLRTTLFILAFVLLASQTFRHAYVRWMEPHDSVMDKYGTDTEKKILSAKNLDELERLYAANKLKIKEEKEAKAKLPEDQRYGMTDAEKSELDLSGAIKDWEQKTREVYELWRFWFAGIGALIAAAVFYRRDRWVGVSFVILAFAEMIWATSQSFRALGGAQTEFDRLLTQKFILSFVSWILLLITWYSLKRYEGLKE